MLKHDLKCGGPANCAVLHPNQIELIVGDHQGTIHLLDLSKLVALSLSSTSFYWVLKCTLSWTRETAIAFFCWNIGGSCSFALKASLGYVENCCHWTLWRYRLVIYIIYNNIYIRYSKHTTGEKKISFPPNSNSTWKMIFQILEVKCTYGRG